MPTTILDLPPEILGIIASFLPRVIDILHFLITQRRFYSPLHSLLLETYIEFWNAKLNSGLPNQSYKSSIVHHAMRHNDANLLSTFLHGIREQILPDRYHFCTHCNGGVTPLIMSAIYGSIENVTTLLRYGIPVESERCKTWGHTAPGATALTHTVANCGHAVVEILMESGADPDVSFLHYGAGVPIYLAVLLGEKEISEILLKGDKTRGTMSFMSPECPLSVVEVAAANDCWEMVDLWGLEIAAKLRTRCGYVRGAWRRRYGCELIEEVRRVGRKCLVMDKQAEDRKRRAREYYSCLEREARIAGLSF